MKRLGKTAQYYFSIFLSIADIGVIVFLAYRVLLSFADSVLRRHMALYSRDAFFQLWLPAILIAVFVCLLFPLSVYRTTLRDEVEYDEQGVSRKYGHFNKLSAEERKRIEQQKTMDSERVLDSATLRQITKKGSADPDGDMKTLVGLEEVKKQMHDMAARMEYDYKYKSKKERRKEKHAQTSATGIAKHMIFFGPPGTGKTTCARIMAGFLYKYGYIRENKCVEVDGNFFSGETESLSTQKAIKLIQKSMGGVLFIDEAYSLLKADRNGYNQSVIATLVKYMEDSKSDFVVILAGYEEEMKELVKSNPGIQSRVNYYFWFHSYSIPELEQIFLSMAHERNYCVSAEAMQRFDECMAKEKKSKNFGNARSVKNCLNRSINQHIVHIMDKKLPEDKLYMLCEEDITFLNNRIDF
jgi:stage V sporulation protein K